MQELTETSGPGHDGIVMRFVVSVDVDTLRATQSDVDGSTIVVRSILASPSPGCVATAKATSAAPAVGPPPPVSCIQLREQRDQVSGRGAFPRSGAGHLRDQIGVGETGNLCSRHASVVASQLLQRDDAVSEASRSRKGASGACGRYRPARVCSGL